MVEDSERQTAKKIAGEMLKAARLKKGLSIAEIVNHLRTQGFEAVDAELIIALENGTSTIMDTEESKQQDSSTS